MGGDAGGPVNLVETLYSNGTRMQCILPDLNIGIGHTMNGFVVQSDPEKVGQCLNASILDKFVSIFKVEVSLIVVRLSTAVL